MGHPARGFTLKIAMILKQYYLGCLAHASYLLGDEESATAIVVDPQRDVEQYLADAERFGLTIRHVFLTHFHADFVAGHLELRDQCGATIYLGARAEAEYSFEAMKDGDTLEFPGVRLQVLETPGHTIESISILVFDLPENETKPYAVLTGRHAVYRRRWAGRTCGLRWDGARRIWARTFTIRCIRNCWSFRMKCWFIRRTARDRFAGRSFRPTRYRRWAISVCSITR